MHRQSKFAQQHLSRRLVRQREYDPPNLDIADLATWAEGEVVIIGHYANGGWVDLGVRCRRLSALVRASRLPTARRRGCRISPIRHCKKSRAVQCHFRKRWVT